MKAGSAQLAHAMAAAASQEHGMAGKFDKARQVRFVWDRPSKPSRCGVGGQMAWRGG
jgi:hypothetical protein